MTALGPTVRHYVFPPVMMVSFTAMVFFLAFYGRDGNLNAFSWPVLMGNSTSWFLVPGFFLWAILFLNIPAKIYCGPMTEDGFSPTYKANGVQYYFSTVTMFLLLALNSSLPKIIFTQMPEILGTLLDIALVLCLYLWWKGKKNNKNENLPMLFEFYRGMELHPRIWGMDVKQLFNSRIGIMSWQLQILAYWIYFTRENGINLALTVNVFLQTIYVVRFYWWETGYFLTLDVTLDRSGFYLCGGYVFGIPGFYTFTTYIMTAQPVEISMNAAVLFSVLGCIGIIGTYIIDLEKQIFRESNGERSLWGGKPKSIPATYTVYLNGRPESKSSHLLVSGMWGISRHMNYVFELLTMLVYALCGWKLGIWAFLYFIFFNFLIFHRIYRDEDKCSRKYGKAWTLYCKTVPYRLIPYIF